MATDKSLVILNGITQRIPDGDTLLVGIGITSSVGNPLSITSNTGNITLTGTFTIQASGLLTTTGSGNINLPNNGSARFQIEGNPVSANVTAANLNILTAGPTSNADALHVHTTSGIPGNANQLSGGAITTGQIVAIVNSAGNPVWQPANAAGAGNLINAVGVSATTVGGAGSQIAVTIVGEIAVPDSVWDSVPAAANVGSRVYLSPLTPGNWTLTAPSTATQWVLKMGILTRGGSGTSRVAIQIGEGLLL